MKLQLARAVQLAIPGPATELEYRAHGSAQADVTTRGMKSERAAGAREWSESRYLWPRCCDDDDDDDVHVHAPVQS